MVKGKSNYFQYSRKEMLKFLPNSAKTSLEIGCGVGNFSKNLQDSGLEAWGVEPDHRSFLVAKEKLHKVFEGTFEDILIDLPSSYFDVIIFNDVLEHLSNPWDILSSSKSLLNKGGVVVASIPNFIYFHDFIEFILSKDFKYKEAGIFDKTHLRFFTKKSIIDMFIQAGYKIELIDGIHPTDSKKFSLFNLCTLGFYKEMKYLQYGIQAKPIR